MSILAVVQLNLQNAEQSSTFYGRVASKGYDGALSGFNTAVAGCAETSDTDKQQWWRAEFKDYSIIDHINIMPRQDCCKERYSKVKVFTSLALHDNSWTLCRDLGNEMETSATWLKVKCLENRVSRYIKLTSDMPENFALCEIEVSGYTI